MEAHPVEEAGVAAAGAAAGRVVGEVLAVAVGGAQALALPSAADLEGRGEIDHYTVINVIRLYLIYCELLTAAMKRKIITA